MDFKPIAWPPLRSSLWLTANFADELGDEVERVMRLGVQGIEALVRQGAMG